MMCMIFMQKTFKENKKHNKHFIIIKKRKPKQKAVFPPPSNMAKEVSCKLVRGQVAGM